MKPNFIKGYFITCRQCGEKSEINFNPEGESQMCNECYVRGFFAINDSHKIHTKFLQTVSSELKQISNTLKKFRRTI